MIEFSHWQVVHNSSNANVKSSESLSNIISLSKVAAIERLKLIRAQIKYIFSLIVNECQVRAWIKVRINLCEFKSIKINEHKKWREISLVTRVHNNNSYGRFSFQKRCFRANESRIVLLFVIVLIVKFNFQLICKKWSKRVKMCCKWS